MTLNCRGLLVDSQGNILARPFPKFFNIGEQPEQDRLRVGTSFQMFEKLDGSLGILYEWNKKACIATRGSFHSDQAEWASNFLVEQYPTCAAPVAVTALFEIIYPENRIVVDYGNRKDLVFLAAIDNHDAKRVEFDWSGPKAKVYKFDHVKQISAEKKQDDFAAFDTGNFEGFVAEYSDGYRVKIKLDEYVRLHRIMAHTTNKSIWEALAAQSDLSQMLESVPDEFYDWVQSEISSFVDQYEEIDLECQKRYQTIVKKIGSDFERRDFAEQAKSSELSAVLFAMLDNRSYEKHIWKTLKPITIKYPPLGCG